MSYYMPDKSIYKVNLQLDNDSFPLIKDHDFDWTIDDDAMMWHAMMIADPLKSVSKGSCACLIHNSIVYYYCLIVFIGMYYISTYTHIFQKPFYRTVHCCAFHHPYLFTYYRYTKYLYPYEYEMKRLSTPSELRAAIDGNKHSSLGYVLTYIESPKGKDQGIISKKGLIIIWI